MEMRNKFGVKGSDMDSKIIITKVRIMKWIMQYECSDFPDAEN